MAPRDRPKQEPSATASLHDRILAEVRGHILAGRWPPGMRIPFEHELAADFGCSRMTVNKALTQLAQAGLVERRRKAGTFVARPRSQAAILDLHEIEREVADLGLPYRFTLVARTVRAARAAEADRLGVPRNTPLLAVLCRHDAGTQPFCLEQRLINLAAVPEAETTDFAAVPPGAWLMAQVPWTEAEHRIRAAAADRVQAEHLGLSPAAACLVIERRTWSGGRPVTAVFLTYPAEAHQLTARFTPAGP